VGILFRVDGEDRGYFAPDGSSLKRMFLKSPISFGRITSGFSKKRFHPILKVNRPHMGVDYAAPTGTPVKAVGDGRVVFSGWSGGGGNVVKIRHNSIYETAYKHLSRYGKNIRNGALVKQGQVIGYVGSTGLSTAPHLHFEFFHAGRYVDPVGKKFPSADPVPANLMSNFTGNVSYKMSLLPTWDHLKESL
jgi:murein DD-endopeptidase MepM/ murein hydrolase activator NlpD